MSQERFALVGMEKVKVWALVKHNVWQIQIAWKTKFAKLLDPTSLASLEIVHALEAAAIQVNHSLDISSGAYKRIILDYLISCIINNANYLKVSLRNVANVRQ